MELRLPEPDLRHLRRLTDDTGIIQHAIGPIPNRRTGYTTDDNARALTVAIKATLLELEDATDLAERYLAFLAYAQREDGKFHNFFSYDRKPLEESFSEDCQGRALQGLVESLYLWQDGPMESAIQTLLNRSLQVVTELNSPRGVANALLAIGRYWELSSERKAYHLLNLSADKLYNMYLSHRHKDWEWFEDTMTYENALLPHALLVAGKILSRDELIDAGLRTLRFLCENTWQGDTFSPIGNKGWFKKGGRKAVFDQQPIEASSTTLACLEAYTITGEEEWLTRALQALQWFTGRNLLGVPLLDENTGGCCDGLCSSGVNLNQGAESSVVWLLARLSFEEILVKRVA
ncbi:mannosyltransferase [Thermocrinis albus DSM 14484]|uniref:Mannosyltransferase n=1 Tax=Thermocrinis albus (strain DSM 14484 / JCM 11386 / HI 11/12) TaxID=638303 RepID=D3SN47_THEAH|nr:hypothetical protein [Thermocrinis albus]ADC90177.1 mannosyltransferase [Thermocrinis albus DSM 14484]